MEDRDRSLLYELQRRIDSLERNVKEANEVAAEAKTELVEWRGVQQKEEARRLRTALMAAGGIIITLGGFVWAEIIWPVIKAGLGE